YRETLMRAAYSGLSYPTVLQSLLAPPPGSGPRSRAIHRRSTNFVAMNFPRVLRSCSVRREKRDIRRHACAGWRGLEVITEHRFIIGLATTQMSTAVWCQPADQRRGSRTSLGSEKVRST